MARLHWTLLTFLLLAAFLVVPLMGSSPAMVFLSLTLFELAAIGAILLGARTRLAKVTGGILALVWFMLTIAVFVGANLHGTVAAFTLAFTLGALTGTFDFLLRVDHSGREILIGAVFGYLLLAMSFAILFVQIERFQPGSFAVSDAADLWSSMLYLSLITLTTLGYGDIFPVTPMAQMITGFEAVVGVLYIAVMIGGIVGRYNHKNNTSRPL